MKSTARKRATILFFSILIVIWSVFPLSWFFLVSLTTTGNIPKSFEIPDVVTLNSYGAVIFGGDFVEVGAKF